MITAVLLLGIIFLEMILLIPARTGIFLAAGIGVVLITAGITGVYLILRGAGMLWDPVHGKKERYTAGIIMTTVVFLILITAGIIMISLGFRFFLLWFLYYFVLGMLTVLNITAFSIKPREKRRKSQENQKPDNAEKTYRRKRESHPGILAEDGQYTDSVFWMKPREHKLVFGCDAGKCQILFRDRHISRVHCVVRYDENRNVYTITDYSKNGTYLQNGKRLKYGEPYSCRTGMSFEINKTEKFRLL